MVNNKQKCFLILNHNTKNNSAYKNIAAIIIYLCIPILCMIYYPTSVSYILRINYIINGISFQLGLGILIIQYLRCNLYIFEPIVLISFIYLLMFFINPMYDIVTGDILWFGVDLFAYGVKGTLIALLGYLSFCFGYYLKKKQNNQLPKRDAICYKSAYVAMLSLVIWIISFVFSMIYLVYGGGKDFYYIITLGLAGKMNPSVITSVPLGFVSMFSYSVIPTSLMYQEYGSSKVMKCIIFYLTLMVQLMRGFRFIVIIFLGAYFILHYLKKNKFPSSATLIIVLIFSFLMTGIVGHIRADLRNGTEINWNTLNINIFWKAVLVNFQIYKTYYALIKAVPDRMPYLYGYQMFAYTLIMFIPRAVWPEKPMSWGGDRAILLGLNKDAIDSGTQYPNVGEYYLEFGVFGVVLFMILYGIIMKRLKSFLMSGKRDLLDLMIYSILLPTNLQIIIRGLTSSNFYLVVFLIGPILLVKKLCKSNGWFECQESVQ